MTRDDLLHGTCEIAAELALDERKVNHLLAVGAIPGWKLAGRWQSSRSALTEFFQTRRAEALARANAAAARKA